MESQKHILIVEDEEDLIEILSFNLELEGFKVTSLTTGEGAVQHIKEVKPDLIILDLMLPGKDGLSICKAVKTDIKTRKTPIIMLTAKNDEQDVVKGLEMGADDYITKPFSIQILIARLRAVLRRKDSSGFDSEAPIQFKDLVIFPNTYRVTINGEPLNLTTAEFKTLTLFVQSPGRVYTRNQIIDSVRGENHIVTDRTIDVLIVGLRKKLNAYAEMIETVRGVGYRFKEL